MAGSACGPEGGDLCRAQIGQVCCGDGDPGVSVAYSPASQTCCPLEDGAGLVVPGTGADACVEPVMCGSSALAETMECCNDLAPYDPTTESCCPLEVGIGNVVIPGTFTEETCPAAVECGGGYSAPGACCETDPATAIDLTRQTCCIDPADGLPAVAEGVLTAAECAAGERCGALLLPPEDECCPLASGHAGFDPTTQTCCPESELPARVVDRVGADACVPPTLCGAGELPAGMECCGDRLTATVYDPAVSKCCLPSSGVVRPIDAVCPLDEFCGGVPLEVGQRCCGDGTVGVAYAPGVEACCNAGTRTVVDGLCPPLTLCQGRPPASGQVCCGDAVAGTLYSPDAQLCCDVATAEVIDRDGGGACEGNTYCGGHITSAPTSCCGDAVSGASFDPERERCCDPAEATVAELDASCPGDPARCGGTPLGRGQECCGDATAGESYQPDAAQCCDPASALILPDEEECPAVEVVCGGVTLPVGEECCGGAEVGAGTPYDPAEWVCCDAATQTLAFDAAHCPGAPRCGELPLAGGMTCCGDVHAGAAYDAATHHCCDPTLSDVRPLGDACGALPSYGTWWFATACLDHVYFSDTTNGVYEVDLATLEPDLVAPAGFAAGSACSMANLVYTDLDAGILSLPVLGGDTASLTGDEFTDAYDLVADQGQVTWSRNATAGSIVHWNPVEPTHITVASSQMNPGRLAFGYPYVYWTDSSGFFPVVRRAMNDGSAAGAFTEVMALRSSDNPAEMLVVADQLYVACQNGGRIATRPVDGSADATEFAVGLAQPQSLATAGGALYWRSAFDGSVSRRPLDGSAPAEPVFAPVGGGGTGDIVIVGTTLYVIDSLTHRVYSTTL